MKLQVYFDTSNKRGIDSRESYIIYRGNEVFLRLVGGPKDFDLLTATAGEDSGKLTACLDQNRLQQAAIETAKEIGGTPIMAQDRLGRSYVKIRAFRLLDDSGHARTEAASFLEEVCDKLFSHYDMDSDGGPQKSDLDEIYEILAVDDSGSDVYLSDGLWLGRDGSIRDLGR